VVGFGQGLIAALDLFETSTVIVLATVREGEEPEILTQYF